MFGRLKFNMRVIGFFFLTLLLAVILSVKLLADALESSKNYERNDSEYLLLSKKLDNLTLQVNRLQDLTSKPFPRVKELNYMNKKRILVTGGAGFVGSHLVDRLMSEGHEVTIVDNFFTGSKKNIEHWIGHENFELIRHDIINPLYVEVDQIYHLASPASPPHYMFNPVKTIKTNTIGTINLLGLARRVGARILVASTSEVYGDPLVHPQNEDYWGHVNPIGPRSCYDEGKRVAEALSYAYAKQEKVEVRVARIFNTYGPRMHINDGRVVSNFIQQALQNNSITIYGSGKQTRSFQYVSDLVDGLILLMNSNYSSPINLGNPEEYTIEEFASVIKEIIGGASPIVKQSGVQDDPQRRRPDIKRAKLYLGWSPKFQSNPGVVHWSGLMKLLGYLQATRNYKLDIGNIAEISLTAYSDADFASCTDDRISVGGHIVFCGNVPVSWRTAKQKSVTLSSMEAEFLSICETAKELMWLKNVLEEFQSTNVLLGDISCKLLSDNMAAIQFSKSSIENNRTKHIDVKFHFVRNLLNLKVFKLLYVNTKMNIADIFTKAQTKFQLNKFNEKLFKN